MAAATTVTAEDSRRARDWFDRHTKASTYEQVGTLVVASLDVVRAAVALLTEAGVEVAEAPPVRRLPGVERWQHGALAGTYGGQPVVIPLVPASPEVRLFAPAEAQAVGELVATVTVPGEQVERGGWVPAAAIATLLQTPAGRPVVGVTNRPAADGDPPKTCRRGALRGYFAGQMRRGRLSVHQPRLGRYMTF
jgi:hypothetical protein